MTRFVITIAALVCAFSLQAQKTTRKPLKAKAGVTELRATKPECDTITGDALNLRITGYEKPLRARRETMLVTNADSCRHVVNAEVEIEYLDSAMRGLHRRTVDLQVSVPPLQTRLVDFPSWDKNCLFYYHLNRPQRINGQATPYSVRIRPVRIIVENDARSGNVD